MAEPLSVRKTEGVLIQSSGFTSTKWGAEAHQRAKLFRGWPAKRRKWGEWGEIQPCPSSEVARRREFTLGNRRQRRGKIVLSPFGKITDLRFIQCCLFFFACP